ncbi:MAG: hypothetical protein QM724_13495 [Flavobacteriales bacterium]
MTQKKAIILGSSLVLLNGLVGHFFAPLGLFLTPVIIPAFAVLVMLTSRPSFTPITGCAFVFALFALNDVLIKLYSGGSHDGEGAGWVSMMAMLGMIPAIILLIVWLVNTPSSKPLVKIAALILFVCLTWAYMSLTKDLGQGRLYWHPWN